MRRGFFAAAPKGPGAPGGDDGGAPAVAAARAAVAAGDASPRPPPSQLSPEAFEQSWWQCLELLASDSDEKK